MRTVDGGMWSMGSLILQQGQQVRWQAPLIPVADKRMVYRFYFLGAVATVYVGQPLDTVKVKMQTFPQLYKNGVNCFYTTLKKDGVRRGLYAGEKKFRRFIFVSFFSKVLVSVLGTVPALAANAAENSVLFAAYGFCQKAVAKIFHKKNIQELKPFHNACAGSLAAIFSTFTLCPTELVKCKLQAVREMRALNQSKTSSSAYAHV